jgi:ParB family transcriptional regulator, chromosome partitioning protein
MADTRRGLGRGLSALLGDTAAVGAREGSPSSETPQQLPLDRLHPNPDQPRRHFGESELAELAESIREHGVLQPILVRPAPGASGDYQIVAGERRWRAARQAGLQFAPVLVRTLDDAEVAEIAIIENVQRADLSPLEEAQGYRSLMERFGRTQDAIAKTVGKSRSHVANALRLLHLPTGVREHLAAGRLSAGHARAIAAAPDPERLARHIVDGELSVREAEALARRSQSTSSDTQGATRVARAKDADTEALEQDLSNVLGAAVEIRDRSGVGELRIRYASLEQLDALCQRLSGSG